MTARILMLWCGCIAAGFVSCTSGRTLQEDAKSDSYIAGRRECPHTWTDTVPTMGGQGFNPDFGALDVPELNDCQRVIVSDGAGGDVYGPLIAIVARKAPPLSKAQLQPVAVAVAEIMAEGEYDPLGLEEGFSCLYFWKKATGEGWDAKIVPRTSVPGNNCLRDQDPNSLPSSIETLEVTPRTAPNFGNENDYPRVARWDSDINDTNYHIGITCLAAWCEVARKGVVPSKSHHDKTGRPDIPTGLRRVYDIKGWYDRQYLANVGTVPDAGDESSRPTRIMGTVFPDSALDTMTVEYFSENWARVGEVALEVRGGSNPYEAEFGYANTPNPKGPFNTVFICHDSGGGASGCIPDGETIKKKCTCFTEEPNCVASGWYARVISVAGDTLYHQLCRYDMPSVPVPGTARWRWQGSDEGNWFRCATGCCELTGEG